MHLEELRALLARHARPDSRADPGRPALGFGLALEPSAVAELLLQAGPGDAPRAAGGGVPSGIAVSDAPAALLDAVVRLLRLLDEPRDRAVLAPLVKREILWRLITGEQGTAVRRLGLADSGLSHVSRTMRRIREHYAELGCCSPRIRATSPEWAGASATTTRRSSPASTAASSARPRAGTRHACAAPSAPPPAC